MDDIFMNKEEMAKLKFELSLKTEEERRNMPFVLFVCGFQKPNGILNGQQAYEYLNEIFKE